MPTPEKGREHAAAIVKDGYRHNDGEGEFEHYPPHRILKVKISDDVVPTMYPDEVSGPRKFRFEPPVLGRFF